MGVLAYLAFVVAVVVGTLALQPPKARRGAWRRLYARLRAARRAKVREGADGFDTAA